MQQTCGILQPQIMLSVRTLIYTVVLYQSTAQRGDIPFEEQENPSTTIPLLYTTSNLTDSPHKSEGTTYKTTPAINYLNLDEVKNERGQEEQMRLSTKKPMDKNKTEQTKISNPEKYELERSGPKMIRLYKPESSTVSPLREIFIRLMICLEYERLKLNKC